MKKVSFPFSNQCYVTLGKGLKKFAPIQAEEAVTNDEVYQALNYRSQASFHRPLILHFEDQIRNTPVWFGFSFDVEVIIVGIDGVVKRTYEMPKYKEGSGIFVQLFSDCSCAILVPKGFCKKWDVLEQSTFVRRTSLQTTLAKKTA